MSQPKIIIGVDFGTTFSGVSWAKTTGKSEKHLVTDWETTSENYSPTNDKVRTAISYARSGTGIANEFGYRANGRRTCLWFKLLLQIEDITNSNDLNVIKETQKQLKSMNKTVDDAMTDYLRWIWLRTDQNLRQYADPSYEKTYGLKVVLTVPAAWKPRAKNRTLQAAKRAGIPADIELVAEPEAAALFLLKSMKEDESLKVGDGIVVCDAGGGTVDLISYQIDSLDPLGLRECAIGEGGLCGSVFIDLEFKRWVISQVGESVYAKTKDPHRREMMRQFEGVKRSFEGDVTKLYSVRLQGIAVKESDDSEDEDDEEDDLIFFGGGVLKQIFENVICKIEALVQGQISQADSKGIVVKKILLIGGFGESTYIYSRLSSIYRKSGLKVLKARNAWTAVTRGATEWGLNKSSIASRISRYHYGMAGTEAFDSARHHEEDRYWDAVRGNQRAKGQMTWLSSKGAHLDVGAVLKIPVTTPYTEKNIQSEERTVTTPYNIFYSGVDDAPAWERSKDVQALCVVEAVLSSQEVLKTARRELRESDGVPIRWVDTELLMELGGTTLNFSVLFNGQTIGTAKVEYIEDARVGAKIPSVESLKIR